MLTEFASYDEIRAVLGVSTDELEDATLALPMYEMGLTFALEDINTGIPDAFKTVSAIPYATRTSAQKRFYDVTRLCSAYMVANELLTSLPYFAETKLQDGRAAKERIADPYSLTRDGVMAGLQGLVVRLSAAYSAINSAAAVLTTATRTYATSVSIVKDPVTNT